MSAPNERSDGVEMNLEGANTPQSTNHMLNVQESLQGVFRRAYSGKSRKAGMDAYCYQCIGFEREEIRHCTAPECGLWEYRPIQPKGKPTEVEQQKIHKRRKEELRCIAAMNKRHVGVFQRAYKKQSRVDAVRAFSIYCLNGQPGPCGTKSCPLAPYCVGARA